ncbi:MAG: hypothetical protein ACTSPY_12135 [Candidatus Helarchaeota archaeon]
MNNEDEISDKKYTRGRIIRKVLKLLPNFKPPFDHFNKQFTKYYIYYCHSIMKMVHIIKTEGKSIDKGLQHDIFKNLFAELILNRPFRFEKVINGRKIDIYVLDEFSIEVKTISDMDLQKIYKTIKAVSELNPKSDRLWIFYFLVIDTTHLSNNLIKKFNSQTFQCIYFLVFIDILLSGVNDLTEINGELEKGVKEVVDRAADKLNIPRKIILPLENLIMVEDLKRELNEKEKTIKEKDNMIKEKDNMIKEKDNMIKEKDKELNRLKRIIKEKGIDID